MHSNGVSQKHRPDWVKLGRTIRYIPDDLNWWLEQHNLVNMLTSNHPAEADH